MKASARASFSLLLAFLSGASGAQQLQLKLDDSLNRQRFIKIGYTYIRPRGATSEVQDLSGPILRYGDETLPGLDANTAGTLLYLSANIRADHPTDYQNIGLGAPRGVRANFSGGGTPIVTLGSWLDDDHVWSVETYVLGLPIRATAQGAGRIGANGGDSVDVGPIATSDQLGPTVFLRYSFGSRQQSLRPSLGLVASYVLFFNTRASSSLEQFIGGESKVNIKNALGLGAVAGLEYRLNDRWTLSGMVGRMKMSTTATVITRTDPQIIGRSLALEQVGADIGPNTLNAVKVIEGGTDSINTPRNGIPATLAGLAQVKTGNGNNLGTYTRSMAVRVDPMIYNISMGYDF